MDVTNLTPSQKNIRSAIRGFLLTATRAELEKELELSKERKDEFRAKCIQELLDE